MVHEGNALKPPRGYITIDYKKQISKKCLETSQFKASVYPLKKTFLFPRWKVVVICGYK